MTPSGLGRTLRSSGLDRALPYLMLGPTLFLVLGVIVYPLIDGLRSSTGFFRFGRLVRDVGLDNYRQAFADPAFIEALFTTARFVFLAVTIAGSTISGSFDGAVAYCASPTTVAPGAQHCPVQPVICWATDHHVTFVKH